MLDLQQQHGVPVDELSSLFDKLKVPGSYMAKGYAADEHAGLFNELNNVQRSTGKFRCFSPYCTPKQTAKMAIRWL